MQIGLRHFGSETIERLISASGEPGATRSGLARLLCEVCDWKDSQERLALSSARKLLPKLAAKAGFRLPEAQPSIPEGSAKVAAPEGLAAISALRCRLRDLGSVSLELVVQGDDRRHWDAMMEAWHPLGWNRAPGGQVRYWIRSSVHGVLGGVGFSAASWHQKARDEWIGWSADARAAHLERVLCNHRFLLLPRIHGLASRVLQMATERIAGDWSAAYAARPVLAYTYVSPEHAGACYRAAGWSCCPQPTSGQPPGSRQPGVRRAVWMKPLSGHWKEALCREPERRIVPPEPVYLPAGADWAAREYARCSHPDGRIRTRIEEMGRAWLRLAGASIPVLFPRRAERKAAYRLLSNESVCMQHILEPHQASTAERRQLEKVVLAVQDSTTLNYHGLAATEGLCSIGGRGAGARGLMAHFGLAVNAVGRPLGVYNLNADFRATEQEKAAGVGREPESTRWLEGMQRARELQDACPDTQVITVCDREGDAWEMLRKAAVEDAGLLVRSNATRQRKVLRDDGTTQDLWAHVEQQPPLAHKTILLPTCGGPRKRKERKVKLDLRACNVVLLAPKLAADQTSTPMLAVSATEREPPKGKEPLHWLLLTNRGEPTAEHAQQIVHWYQTRWAIETWFSVLKTGTRVKDRQLDDAEDLRKCLTFDAITACHVHDLNFMARTVPDTPASQVVGQEAIDCLYNYRYLLRINRSRAPPGENLDIRTFVIDLAGIAGFDSTKRQPLPGTRKLWEAYLMYKPILIYHRGMNADK